MNSCCCWSLTSSWFSGEGEGGRSVGSPSCEFSFGLARWVPFQPGWDSCPKTKSSIACQRRGSAEREEGEGEGADLWVGELEADDVLGLAPVPAADEVALEGCEDDGPVVVGLAEDPVWDVDDGHR